MPFIKNAQGLAAGTHQIWIQQVQIDIKQHKNYFIMY